MSKDNGGGQWAGNTGQHYCQNHQGNHSHYAEHNCVVCKLQAELSESEARRLQLETNQLGLLDHIADLEKKLKETPSFEEVLEMEILLATEKFKSQLAKSEAKVKELEGRLEILELKLASDCPDKSVEISENWELLAEIFYVELSELRKSEEQKRFTAACRAIDQAIKTKGE